jgi:arylsulfatase A-like enzyme
LLDRTLIVVGAKHGQSPIDVHTLHMIRSNAHPNPRAILDVTDPIDLLTAAGVPVAQETADDISLPWLGNQEQVDQAVSILQADLAGPNRARIQTIYSGEELERLFGDPRNGRTPDIIIQPIPGTIYSGSANKIAEHGGFAENDRHVLLVVSNPSLEPRTIASPVTNMQVAPTILSALGLDPRELQAVRREGTTVLPGLAE